MTVTHQTSYNSYHDDGLESDDIIIDDVVGVKELFETHENALLPIDQQIRRYRKRDLYASHFHRTSCRILGPRKNVRRVHFNDGDPSIEATSGDITHDFHCDIKLRLPPYYADSQVGRSRVKATQEEVEATDNRSWLQNRMKLRYGLNNMGLSADWLRRKPDKTELEERVLTGLMDTENKRKGDERTLAEQPNASYPPHIRQTINGITEYLWGEQLSVEKYFGEACMVSYKHCKEGLEALQKRMPMTRLEIDEILKHFYKYSRRPNQLFHSCLSSSLKSFPLSKHSNQGLVPRIRQRSISEENSYQKYKESRLAEYNEVVKLCEERGVPLTESLLRKVLLHPGDLPATFKPEVKVRQPSDVLSRDFWKPKEKKPRRKINPKELLPPTQPVINEASTRQVNSAFNPSNMLSCESVRVQDILEYAATSSTESYDMYSSQASFLSDLATPIRQKRVLLPKLEGQNKAKHKRHNHKVENNQRSTPEIRTKTEPSLITLPRLRDVMPERHQMNLSTGRAVISRKVDCWLSFEEYEKITSQIETEWVRERPVPNAFWPGHLLDKLRICLTPPRGHRTQNKHAVFQNIKSTTRGRCNHGYNNNELSWPADATSVKYGNIDTRRV